MTFPDTQNLTPWTLKKIASSSYQKKLVLLSSKITPGTLVKIKAGLDSSSYEKSFNGTIGMVLEKTPRILATPLIRVLLNEKIVEFHVLDLEAIETEQTEKTQNK